VRRSTIKDSLFFSLSVVCLCRSSDSNPGAATPCSLYRLYSKHGAVTANPYVLRQPALQLTNMQFDSDSTRQRLLVNAPGGSVRRHNDSPPRAQFRLLKAPPQTQFSLSLTSLR
jgi:hypothetical protein